jgi:hypothetical protein
MQPPKLVGITAMRVMPMTACGTNMAGYAVSQGKSETYSVEAGNAELRHSLAHLARSSRCSLAAP